MYVIDEGPLLPSLEHLIEYYSIRADGLPSKLTLALSKSKSTFLFQKNFSVKQTPNFAATLLLIGGSKGGASDATPSCSCSFRQNSCQIIDLWPKFRGWHPRLGNPGSATGTFLLERVKHENYIIVQKVKLRTSLQENSLPR